VLPEDGALQLMALVSTLIIRSMQSLEVLSQCDDVDLASISAAFLEQYTPAQYSAPIVDAIVGEALSAGGEDCRDVVCYDGGHFARGVVTDGVCTGV
jgi:hypothetical protein